MTKIPEFMSDLAAVMTAYCAQQQCCHADEIQRSRILRQFDRYCQNIGHCTGCLDAAAVNGFLASQTSNATDNQISVIRSLAYYLHQRGIHAYVIPLFSTSDKKTNTKQFASCLAEQMKAFTQEKRSLGYTYQNEERFLRQFDEFLVEHAYEGTQLTPAMVRDYSARRGAESKKTRKNKLSIVKLFGMYLIRMGEQAYIFEEMLGDAYVLPYVFSHDEITAFFLALDTNTYRFHWGKYLYPVYFRILYTTGMRETEACRIVRTDIEYEWQRILIRDAKGQKDRYVYVSETTCHMLKRFDAKFEQFFPCRKFLFIGTTCTADSHLSNTTVKRAFRKCWSAAGLPYDRANGISPCVHAFRHTYVVDKIAQWHEEGRNVNALMPYLSAQLGHKSLQTTYQYCMRLDARFGEIMDSAVMNAAIVPEVMG